MEWIWSFEKIPLKGIRSTLNHKYFLATASPKCGCEIFFA